MRRRDHASLTVWASTSVVCNVAMYVCMYVCMCVRRYVFLRISSRFEKPTKRRKEDRPTTPQRKRYRNNVNRLDSIHLLPNPLFPSYVRLPSSSTSLVSFYPRSVRVGEQKFQRQVAKRNETKRSIGSAVVLDRLRSKLNS